MKYVNQPIMKSDAMALVTGKPVYLDDIAPHDCLIVKVLRSPHANALIENINTAIAAKVPGIVGVYTYSDVSQKRFTDGRPDISGTEPVRQTHPRQTRPLCRRPSSHCCPAKRSRLSTEL